MFELTAADELVHEFVRQVAFALVVGVFPDFEHVALQAAESLLFGDAGIGDAVHVVFEQFPLVLRGQVAVMGHALVVRVGHEVHQILFEVGSGAGDDLHLVLTDHFGQRNAQFGRTHRTAERNHHFTAGIDVGFVAFGGVDQGGRVEVAVMMGDKSRDRSLFHFYAKI